MAIRELLAQFFLGVDTSQVDKAEKKVKKFQDDAAKGGGGGAGAVDKLGEAFQSLAGGLFIGKISSFFDGLIEQGSRVKDLSDKLGVGTDELQKFQYGAGLSGVEAESAAQALGFLNKNVGEAISGNAEAAKTFAGLDVALKDNGGNVRELGDLIPELADSFVKMGSDQERTAAAMKIFGKSGAALLPFLKGGSEGVAALSKEFDELGGELNSQFIKEADETGDQIDRLKFSFQGLKVQLGIVVLPLIRKGAERFTEISKTLVKYAKETNAVRVAVAAFGAAGSIAFLKWAAGLAKLFGLTSGAGGGGFLGTIKGFLSLGLQGALIAGAIALIFLAVEDLYTLFTGGDSLIGEWLDSFLGIEGKEELLQSFRKAVDDIYNAFLPLQPLVTIVGDALSQAFANGLPEFIRIVYEALIAVQQILQGIAVVLANVTSLVGDALVGIGKLLDKASTLAQAAGFNGLAASLENRSIGTQQAGEGVQATGKKLQDATGNKSFGDGLTQIGAGAGSLFDLGTGGAGGRLAQAALTDTGIPAPVGAPAVPAPPAPNVTQDTKIVVNVQGGPTGADTGKAVAGEVKKVTNTANQAALAALNGGG